MSVKTGHNHRTLIKFNTGLLFSPHSNFSNCPEYDLCKLFSPQSEDWRIIFFFVSCLFSFLYQNSLLTFLCLSWHWHFLKNRDFQFGGVSLLFCAAISTVPWCFLLCGLILSLCTHAVCSCVGLLFWTRF